MYSNTSMKETSKWLLIILLSISMFSATSCLNTKNAVYFNNIQDTILQPGKAEIESSIQAKDLLSISVSSLNPEATIIFNTPNVPTVSTSTAAGTSTQMAGYLVTQEGNIQFPVLGNITAAGLTKKQLSDDIAKRLLDKKLLIDPIVNVRFLNFKVTVLGEVARPTVVTVANEKISILEALGMAGDLTIYAKRDNVLLIREESGKKVVKRVNLNSSQILTSPYYYLKTNDVVYAEPNNTKVSSASNTRQMLPTIISGLSFIAIILTQLFK
jgi:polysaccharide export outer membrane protein